MNTDLGKLGTERVNEQISAIADGLGVSRDVVEKSLLTQRTVRKTGTYKESFEYEIISGVKVYGTIEMRVSSNGWSATVNMKVKAYGIVVYNQTHHLSNRDRSFSISIDVKGLELSLEMGIRGRSLCAYVKGRAHVPLIVDESFDETLFCFL